MTNIIFNFVPHTYFPGVLDVGLKSSSCTTNALQRTVINSLNAAFNIKIMLSRMKSAVAIMRMSHSQTAYLREAQRAAGMFDHQLIQSMQHGGAQSLCHRGPARAAAHNRSRRLQCPAQSTRHARSLSILKAEFGTARKVVSAIFKLKTLMAAERVVLATCVRARPSWVQCRGCCYGPLQRCPESPPAYVKDSFRVFLIPLWINALYKLH